MQYAFRMQKIEMRVLNSSTIMLTSTTELSLKGKESLDLNANLITAVSQHHGTGIAKTPNTDALLEVYPAGVERKHDAQSAPKQTTQRPCAFTPESSARVEKDSRFQVLSVAHHLEVIVTNRQTTVNKTDTFHMERLLKTEADVARSGCAFKLSGLSTSRRP